MNKKIREHVEELFAEYANSGRAVELREELISNLIDKYNDLLKEGKEEQQAYNIVIASIGDVDELMNDLGNDYNQTVDFERQKSALLISIAVGLYIFCPIPAIFINYFRLPEAFGAAGVISIAAVATMIIVYANMTKPKYKKVDDTIVEEFKEWKIKKSHSRSMQTSMQSTIWLITLVVYFLVSFNTGAWYISWVIFLISAAVSNIIRILFNIYRD